MRRATIALVLLQLSSAAPALAHGGHEHISDWQVIINGVGIIAVVLYAAHALLTRKRG